MPKLIDIKDADGKEPLIPEIKPYVNKVCRTIEEGYRAGKVEGCYQSLEEQSQRQVAVEVDREKLAKALFVMSYKMEIHCAPDEYAWKQLNKQQQGNWLIRADALIAHKEELFKIIYVKD